MFFYSKAIKYTKLCNILGCIHIYQNIAQVVHAHTHTHGLTALFPGSPGLAGPPFNLLRHSTRSWATSRLRPISFMSLFTTSIHVFCGLPLGFSPSTSKTVQPYTQSQSSFLSTCPNHLSLFRFTTTTIASIFGSAEYSIWSNIRSGRITPSC